MTIILIASLDVISPIHTEVRKLRHRPQLQDLNSYCVVELRFESKESGSRRGCVHKTKGTQMQETYSDTHIGPAVSLPLYLTT